MQLLESLYRISFALLNMTEITQEYLSRQKRYFREEYFQKIKALGYCLMMSTSFQQGGLVARIEPITIDQAPVSDDLLAKIREEVLPKIFNDVPVFVTRGEILRPFG